MLGARAVNVLEMALFGLLFHPQGMVWLLDPFVLGPTGGKTELERGIELAIGAPDTTYRRANMVHRAYRRALGSVHEPERTGPKPGNSRRTSTARQRFEDHVRDRAGAGGSAYTITQEVKAQRLYRRAKKGKAVYLNEQAVRRVLIKSAKSGPSS